MRHVVALWGALLSVGIGVGYPAGAANNPGKTATPMVAPATPPSPGLMPETLRSEIHDVVIVPGTAQTDQQLTGSYGKDGMGATGGMVQGSKLGFPSVGVGNATVGISIPELILPGMLAGSLFGTAKQELQDFRDALAKDLANAKDQPLTNSRLALHVYQELRGAPDVQSHLFAPTVEIPEDTDAVLFVNINDVTIDVDGDDAVLKTTAEISLRSQSDGSILYRKWFYYQDRDSLGNWTANDNALWRDYTNFALDYLGRAIATDLFTGVDLSQQLQPVASKTLSISRNDVWQGSSKSRTPVLAWKLTLPEHNADYPWADNIGESNITYDLEIFDNHHPVYGQQGIADPSHQLAYGLDACKTYRWSVRPAYHVNGDIKYGDWMRSPPQSGKGTGSANEGKKASEAPALIQYFPTLKIDCHAK
ncbi:MAG: hypothetical protein WB812_06330 [Woeseiaceae bacterium]